MAITLSSKKRSSSSKNPNYFSHEFIIQNHGDIVTCIFMLFIVGMMFQVSAPLASMFVTPKYNISELNSKETIALYSYGWQDLTLTVFYSLACVIFHAIVQEFLLDKIIKKLKLSKTRTTKFNESGQLLAFLCVSLVWLVSIFLDEGYFQSISFFWTSYPHVGLRFWTKMFMITQMAYWLHTFPELYFQKVKREDMQPKITVALVYLFAFTSIYVLNLTRIGLALVLIEYLINIIHHVARITLFTGKIRLSKTLFKLFNLSFVTGRLLTLTLTILVFWYGLSTSSIDTISIQEGNFNTNLTRLTCIGGIFALQAWIMWNFILFHSKKRRESAVVRANKKLNGANSNKKTQANNKSINSSADNSDDQDAPQAQESLLDGNKKVKSS